MLPFMSVQWIYVPKPFAITSNELQDLLIEFLLHSFLNHDPILKRIYPFYRYIYGFVFPKVFPYIKKKLSFTYMLIFREIDRKNLFRHHNSRQPQKPPTITM